MRKLLELTICLFLLSALVTGCGYKHYLKSGKEDYNNLIYSKAKTKFNKALQKKPESYESLKMLALTLEKMKDYKGAEKAYQLAMNYPQVTIEDKFNYANMLMSSNKHERAELVLREYLAARPTDVVAKSMLESCQFIGLFMEDTSKYRIKALPLLSNLSMFSPTVYNEGIAFTAERVEKGANNPWTGNSYNDIYYVESVGGTWSEQKPVSQVFNGKYNDGPIAFNKESDYAVFTRSNTSNEGNKRLKNEDNYNNLFLYSANLVDGSWKNVVALPFNSEDYSCVHPSLTSNADTLYFASDMPGGQGRYDIYMSTRTGGSWTNPKNLGPEINTPANDVFPVVAYDGSLYFSSDGHPSLGALDIFRSVREADSWKKPRNLNFPINSTSDDFSFVYDGSDSAGYFASNRNGVDRIYEFTEAPTGIVFIDGMVRNPDGSPMEGATVKLINVQNGEVIKEVVTGPDGKFDFELYSDRLYKIESSKEGYFTESYERSTADQYSDKNEKLVFDMRKLIVTDPNSDFSPTAEGVYEVENIYYDFNKFNIRPDAALELNKLHQLMVDNPTISIELHSHTDARGNDDYNMELSDKRAKSAKAYLVKKGIDVDRLATKGFGESRIINRCKNDIDCNEVEHQENRRTEFIVTGK